MINVASLKVLAKRGTCNSDVQLSQLGHRGLSMSRARWGLVCTTRCLSSDRLQSGLGADRRAEGLREVRPREEGGEVKRRKRRGQLYEVLCFSLCPCLYTDVTVSSAVWRAIKA